MSNEYKICKNQHEAEFKEPKISVHETEYLDQRARLTMDMIKHWGMVAGKPDGEDSTGRAQLKLASEEEVVDRAMKMTSLAFKEFNKNNWITHLPTIETMREMIENKELDPA